MPGELSVLYEIRWKRGKRSILGGRCSSIAVVVVVVIVVVLSNNSSSSSSSRKF